VHVWALIWIAAFASASPAAQPPEADLTSTLQATDFAEIYIVRRDLHFITGLVPYMVRTVGCRYLVYRNSPDWTEFERAMAAANVRIVPTPMNGEVRVGLVLSDNRGTLREIYSNDLVWPNGRANGFDQRQEVEISPSFATALQGFAMRHPELARPDTSPVPHCPQAVRDAVR
jgi:hypothetical protein